MGGKQSTPEEKEKARKNKQLEYELQKNAEIDKQKVKLLLLGAGECGKSTIFKQMKLIYGAKFTESERKQKISSVVNNIISSMQVLIIQADIFCMIDNIQDKVAYKLIQNANADDQLMLTDEMAEAVITLWKDPAIQDVWNRRSEYQLVESVKYYFNKINDIKGPTYLPSDDDILYLRVRTSGNI